MTKIDRSRAARAQKRPAKISSASVIDLESGANDRSTIVRRSFSAAETAALLQACHEHCFKHFPGTLANIREASANDLAIRSGWER
jgi:hypothetical protein